MDEGLSCWLEAGGALTGDRETGVTGTGMNPCDYTLIPPNGLLAFTGENY